MNTKETTTYCSKVETCASYTSKKTSQKYRYIAKRALKTLLPFQTLYLWSCVFCVDGSQDQIMY